jgi:hypothetical protein
MGNTANNNWPYPESTDLVKDGATAIENLADAIDTTLGVFVPSNPGLTLINTTSFSGVSSQSVNDVFSASYSVYFVDMNVSTSAASGTMDLRLRVGGADTSTTIYRRQYLQASSTTLIGARETTNTSFVGVIPFETSRNSGNNLMIVNPFETVPTSGVSHWAQSLAGNIAGFSLWYGINDSVSYTGFTILPSTGTMTGTISVYGKQR